MDSHRHHHKKHLRIVTPDGAAVQQRHAVVGVMRPRGQSVTIYVKARDGRWYLQAASAGLGVFWRVPCVFGSADAPTGTVYQIAACFGANPLKAEKLDVLPAGQWVYHNVVRA